MGGTELKYIHEAFDTNWVAPLGPNVDGFEIALEQCLSNEVKVAALSSGTAALHLALIECGVGYGDEVICQSLTFSASANPIAYQGAIPVFVDSEMETWNMCPTYLREAIEDRVSKGKKPKAIIVVHLYGMPAKMDEILLVANEYGIPVIEDAAEALGSAYKGKPCGTFGKFGVLSFNGNKIITTSGGGALVCHNQEDRDRVVFLATQARDDAPHYQHSNIGYNYRMSNISAGIGRGQMEVLDSRVDARRAMNDFYLDLFSDTIGISLLREPNENFISNHWLSAVTLDSNLLGFRPQDLSRVLSEANIESRPLWKPMHMQPIFAESPYYGGNVSEGLFTNGVCLPSGSNLNDVDRKRIRGAFKKIF